MTVGRAFLFLVAVYALNLVAIHVVDIYGWWPDFDIVMHTLGGIGAGLFGLALFERGRGRATLPRWMRTVFVLGVVMILAVGWEWHEFALDTLRGTQMLQLSIADTMLDMLCGFIGGLLVCVVKRK